MRLIKRIKFPRRKNGDRQKACKLATELGIDDRWKAYNQSTGEKKGYTIRLEKLKQKLSKSAR